MIVILPFCGHAIAEPLSTPDYDNIEWPNDDPASAEMIELGKMLFFDPRLVPDENQSCASCHDPDMGFSDGVALDVKHNGKNDKRNSPSIVNLAFSPIIHWDGRSRSLEHQAFKSMGKRGVNTTFIPKIKKIKWYQDKMQTLFPDTGFTQTNMATAIGAFERSLISNNASFDKYLKGNKAALTPSAKRGLELFEGKGRCIACHDGATFSDYSFHNIGVNSTDKGRGGRVDDKTLIGAFKTPGLRNVWLTAPYMHNGSIPSLEGVIQFYNRGGDKAENRSKLIKPLHLTRQEELDLVAFLAALTDTVVVERPTIPWN
ncbi:hypothetical protein A9Q99_20925 [Gammaproteobacteria bacterium 45_16_T64]|nr:hypothetical protein A9Q99_20925 [Gammaproteobacteria bacterium 45_16_T64]